MCLQLSLFWLCFPAYTIPCQLSLSNTYPLYWSISMVFSWHPLSILPSYSPFIKSFSSYVETLSALHASPTHSLHNPFPFAISPVLKHSHRDLHYLLHLILTYQRHLCSSFFNCTCSWLLWYITHLWCTWQLGGYYCFFLVIMLILLSFVTLYCT